MAMRDEIEKAIIAGGATKESLLELTGTTDKGLASQFTYLRMMGRCPMKQEDGTFKMVTADEWEAHRASGAGRAGKILTPAEKVTKAEKRSKRAASAYDNAKKRTDENPDDRLAQLKFIKAEAELEISEIELGLAEQALRDAPPEEVDETEETPEVNQVDDFDVEEDLE